MKDFRIPGITISRISRIKKCKIQNPQFLGKESEEFRKIPNSRETFPRIEKSQIPEIKSKQSKNYYKSGFGVIVTRGNFREKKSPVPEKKPRDLKKISRVKNPQASGGTSTVEDLDIFTCRDQCILQLLP